MVCRALGGSKLQPYQGSSIRLVILWSYLCYLFSDVAYDPGCLVPCYSILYFARMHFVETPGLDGFFFFLQGNADFKICLKLSYCLITFE